MPDGEPRRRRSDARRSGPVAFGPTPGPIGPPDPEGAMRAVGEALSALRRARRPMTLASLELEPPADEGDLVQLAELVRAQVRDSDGLWRDGPLALLILLTDADGPSADVPLGRIRRSLRGEGYDEALLGRASPPPGIDLIGLMELLRDDARPLGPEGA